VTPSSKKAASSSSAPGGSQPKGKQPAKPAKGEQPAKPAKGRASTKSTQASRDAGADGRDEGAERSTSKARVLQASKAPRAKARERTPARPARRSPADDAVEADEVDGVERGDVVDRARPEPDDYRDDAEPAPAATGWRALLAPSNPDYVAPKERERPWWGMGDVAIWGLVAFFVLPLLIAIPIGALLSNLGYDLTWPVGHGARLGEATRQFVAGQPVKITQSADDVPLWLYQLYIALPLWIGFAAGPVYVSFRKGLGFVRDWKVRMELIDVPIGLAVGLFSQLVLVAVVFRILFLFVPEQDVSSRARDITDRATSPAMVVALIVMVGIITPICEELFFRGLSHQAFKKRLGRWWGATATSALFAITHGSYILMPPLFLFAFVLSWLVDRFDRLGPAVFAHIGFNLVTAVGLVWNLGVG